MNTVTPAARALFEIVTSDKLRLHAPNAASYSERALAFQAIRGKFLALTDLLARHLTAIVQKANGIVELALSEKSTAALVTDGMFCLDALAADELESAGSYGAELANDLRCGARERCGRCVETAGNEKSHSTELSHLWSPKQRNGLVPFVSLLANALWHDIVEPRLREAKPAALSLEVVERIESAFWSRDRRIETRIGGSVIKIDREIVARLQTTDRTPELPAEVFSCLTVTRSLAAHRLLRFLVAEGYAQYFVNDACDYRKVVILHGFAGLSARLGLRGGKAADKLRRALLVMQHAHIELPHGSEVGGLLSWTFHPEAHGRPAVLSIVLGDALLPNYVVTLPKGPFSAKRARMLVPIPVLLPPFVGRERDHAAQAVLQILVMTELRENASELVKCGAVRILPQRWRQLAECAGVPKRLLPELLDRWKRDGRDAPAFLRSPGADIYTLATPTYERQLATLLEAGNKEVDGRRRAKYRGRYHHGFPVARPRFPH